MDRRELERVQRVVSTYLLRIFAKITIFKGPLRGAFEDYLSRWLIAEYLACDPFVYGGHLALLFDLPLLSPHNQSHLTLYSFQNLNLPGHLLLFSAYLSLSLALYSDIAEKILDISISLRQDHLLNLQLIRKFLIF